MTEIMPFPENNIYCFIGPPVKGWIFMFICCTHLLIFLCHWRLQWLLMQFMITLIIISFSSGFDSAIIIVRASSVWSSISFLTTKGLVDITDAALEGIVLLISKQRRFIAKTHGINNAAALCTAEKHRSPICGIPHHAAT